LVALYNEIDPYAVRWLRALIDRGLIADGIVDDRPIQDLRPSDVAGFTQCHFFAGLGGWSLALRTAGWPDDRPVWTGSCPCQPFSVSGKRKGFDDPRHLWPFFRDLIREHGASTVFGEQVAGASDWLSLVRGDLEAMGRAVGAIPIEAACAGADHFRDRYWFVAHRDDERSQKPIGQSGDAESQRTAAARDHIRAVVDDPELGWGEGGSEHEFRSRGFTAAIASLEDRQYFECPDGKWRRLPPPRVRWLGNGVPARVDKLRAIGNAIDPRPAAAFIKSFMEVTG